MEDEKFIQIIRLPQLPSEPAEDAGPTPPLGHQLQACSGSRGARRGGGTRKIPLEALPASHSLSQVLHGPVCAPWELLLAHRPKCWVHFLGGPLRVSGDRRIVSPEAAQIPGTDSKR